MKLTQERLFDILDYDFETGIFRWKKTMRASAWAGDVAGDVKPNGYIRIYFDGRGYYAHRLAWFYFYGTWPKGDIDHINRKKDDNRIRNLRQATRSQNLRNQKIRSTNTTGYKGVTQDKRNGKFIARIGINNKTHCLGAFNTAWEAHEAYIDAAEKAAESYVCDD